MSPDHDARIDGEDPATDTVVGAPAAHPAAGTGRGARIEHMVIPRESDESDSLLMEVMIQRTCSLRPDVPGCAEMAAAGLDPLLHPERYGATLHREGRNRSVLFMRSGTLFLYWMGSAATMNTEAGENLYSAYLVNVIRKFRPRHIYVAAFTRLVRSALLSKDLGRVCAELRVTIHYPGGTIEPWTPWGEALWNFQALFAAMERNEIVSRNLLGAIASGQRNACPFGVKGLPPGYVADDHGRVHPDPEMGAVIKAMLTVLADASLSYADAAKHLGGLGITRPLLAVGGDINTADARDPATIIRGLLPWAELYETGTWTMRRPNPLPGLDKVGPIVVERDQDGDPGTLDIPFEWGLPDGGWADPEIFSLLRSRRALDDERARRGGGSSGLRRRKPFAGLCAWSDDDWDWLVDTNGHGTYRLRRRHTVPVTETTNGAPGWADSTTSGDVVDRFSCRAFHEAFVDAVTTALTHGAPATLEEGHVIEHERSVQVVRTDRATVLADIDRCIDATTRKLRRYIDLAAGDDDLAEEFHAAATAAKAELRRLEKRRQRHLDERPAPAAPVVRCDADHIARVIAALATVDGVTDGVVGEALRALVIDLRFGDRDEHTRSFTFRLRLPAETGLLELGPITGRVPVKDRPHPATGSRTARATVVAEIDDLLHQGVGGQAIVDQLRVSPTYVRDAATELLGESTVTRHALNCLLGAPLDELRATVWPHLRRGPVPDPLTADWIDRALLPDGVDPLWTAHALTTYLGRGVPILHSHWAAASQHRADAVAHTLAAGGTLTLAELADALGNIHTRPQLAQLTEDEHRGAAWMPVLARHGTWERNTQHRRLAPTCQVACTSCPHCGGHATRVIHVPEVPRHLMCPDCARMPTPDSPVFPAPYLQLPAKLERTPAPTHTIRRHGTRRPPPDADAINAIITDYQAGIPILGDDSITTRHEINSKRLYTILDKHNIPRRSPRNASRAIDQRHGEHEPESDN